MSGMDTVARASRLLAAVACLGLAWLLYDWLGDPWDHCDYPDECLSSWFGRTFLLVQGVWIIGLAISSVALFAAWRARWSRRELAVLWAGLLGLLFSLAFTPLHWGGLRMTSEEVEGNWFVWGSLGAGYKRLAALAALAGLVMAWRAASGHPRTRRDHPTTTRG